MATISTRLPAGVRGHRPDFEVPLPPEFWRGGGAVRLRDLLAVIVRWEILAREAHAAGQRRLRALTARQIADGAAQGKVDSGGHVGARPIDVDQAVGNAWQCFEDGLYLVFIDGQPQQGLDDLVVVRADSRILFVRLVTLGSLW